MLLQDDRITPMRLTCKFPQNREVSREFFENSPDSGLLGQLLEPIVKRIQRLVSRSLFLQKQGNFLSEQGIRLGEQEVCRRNGDAPSQPYWFDASSPKGRRMLPVSHSVSVVLRQVGTLLQ